MRVPNYQIYNILNIYSRWVSNNKTSSLEKFSADIIQKFYKPGLSEDRYRQSIMQRVAGNIVSKITCLESNDKRSQKIAEKLKEYEGKNGGLNGKNGGEFVFNAIDEISGKITNTLLIDKSCFLAKQTQRSAKKEGS